MAGDLNEAISTLGRSASGLGQGAAEVRGLLDDTHKTLQAQDAALQSLASAMQEVAVRSSASGMGRRPASRPWRARCRRWPTWPARCRASPPA
jgi:hypothetical protein